MLSGKWRPFCLGLNVLIFTPGFEKEMKVYEVLHASWSTSITSLVQNQIW